ncbi:MAG: putative peptidyl-prolyl cis-trans isomerase [Flavobacterium sp. SCGC AAA160-P02]|nr:MAG: putative peptidyl-prolyl cis-trans isomerase [Flavobacterium sp. SCGC AAA160-P02]
MKNRILQMLVVFSFAFTACNDEYKNFEDGIYADISTNKGKIIVQLFPEEVPLTVSNFITLAEGTNTKVTDSLEGKKYYDGLKFHRVIRDFMIQGGDPQGNGQGGPGYKFYDEFNPTLKHDSKGILSMANSGINTNGSQFFITRKATPWLDAYTNENQLKDCNNPRVGCHSVFGKVVSDLDILDSIAQNDVIEKIKIVRKGSAAKEFDAVKVFEEEIAKGEEKEKARLVEMQNREKERLEKFMKDKEVFYKKMNVKSAKKQESGLQILTFKKGRGKKFNSSKPATINYTMYLADGKKIQSTEGATPFEFILDERPLIPAVKEAILNMRVGGKVRLFIPYYLGYGENGGGPFPKKADLIFDLELVNVGD